MDCTCISGFGNTGAPNCNVALDVAKQLIFVPYFKADGTVNGIDLAGLSVIDQAFLDAKFKANDANERWYPTPEIKNIEDIRGDDIVETFEDATTAFIQEGPRTFNGFIVGAAPQFKGIIDSLRCKKVGVFTIDKSGNLGGDNSVAGKLNPVRLQDNSLSTGFVKTTDTTIQKVSIGFTVDQLMDDANIGIIEATNITGVLLGATGLLDAIAVTPVEDISATGFKVTLNTLYGGALSKVKAKGLEVGDFEIFDNTGSATVTPTSVTEAPEGVYTFVIPSTVASTLTVGNKATGELDKGYDINDFTVVTP